MAEIATLGIDGFVVRFASRLTDGGNRAALAFRADLETRPPEGVAETCPALASVYVRAAEGADPDAVAAALAARLASRDWEGEALPEGRRRWRVPAVFGGSAAPALAESAAAAGVSPEEAVRALTAAPLRVLAIGFAPGQPYLGELEPRWNLPRLSNLVDVPAGALVLAIRQLVLFANPSPTGWRHVAQTGFRPFRPEAADPFPLRPGDEMSLRAVPEAELDALLADPEGGAERLA